MRTYTLKYLLLALTGLAAANQSGATPVGASGVLDPNNPCNRFNWQITGAIPSALYGGGVIPAVNPAIAATSCAGVYEGNEGPALNPSPNLGYLNDGLLNGEYGLLSPTQFISSSQLMNLDGVGGNDDPGWIKLGDLSGNAGGLTYAKVGAAQYDLGDVISYSQTQTSNVGGEWTLLVNANIKAILESWGVLNRSSFDHLAFSVKSSTSWAVYDFDFNVINTMSGGAFDLSQPYTLRGTWTMNGDFENDRGNDQDISHISVWARDPIRQNDVPIPGTLALVGLALVGLWGTMRLKFSAL